MSFREEAKTPLARDRWRAEFRGVVVIAEHWQPHYPPYAWRAWVEDRPGCWGAGRSREEAIGDAIISLATAPGEDGPNP